MSGPKVTADRPRRSWVPAGTIAFLAALYSAGYFYWEQSHWGSQAVRDLVGNVAFMPFNLAVLVLFWLASRQEVLDPRVRRPLRLLALGGGMVFTGNAISAVVRARAPREPAGLLGRPVLPLRLAAHADGAAALPAGPAHPAGAVEVPARRGDGAGGRRGRDLVLLGPADGRVAGEQRRGRRCWRSPIRWRACWCCSASPPCCSAGRSTATGVAFGLLVTGVSVGVVADLTFNLVQLEVGGRSASWADARLPGLLRDADRERGALLAPAGAAPDGVRRCRSPGSSRSARCPTWRSATTYGLLLIVALRPWTDPDERARDRRPAGDRAGGAAPAPHRARERAAPGRDARRGRTRRASARWCSTRPTSSW